MDTTDEFKEIEALLSSSGYLPPRNEEELCQFDELYKDYQPVNAGRHIDIPSIIKGTCQCRSIKVPGEEDNTSEEDIDVAARNYDSLPKSVIDKIRKQHHHNGNSDQ